MPWCAATRRSWRRFAALAVVTGILHFAHVQPVAVFVVAAAALGGLAWAISIATESVGERFGPAVTGALQSTLDKNALVDRNFPNRLTCGHG